MKILTAVKDIFNNIRQDKFQVILLLVCIGIFAGTSFMERGKDVSDRAATEKAAISIGTKANEVHFFYQVGCPHCHEEMRFLESQKIEERYPAMTFYAYDIAKSENRDLFLETAEKFNIKRSALGTPITVIGTEIIQGFDKAETTGVLIEEKIKKSLQKPTGNLKAETQKAEEKSRFVDVPFFGQIDVFKTSLPVLSVVLGLIDGFNPCAMWMLVYLISLVIGLSDKRKMWTIVFCFVATEGIMYFLFMTAWLNVFLYVGYLRMLTLGIGLFALYAGILNVRTYLQTDGALPCKVGDLQTKQRIRTRMERLVNAPMTLLTFFGIVMLAFVVNAMEFVCSAAIPAIFTNVLANANISSAAHYGYILLYDIFYMLDDFVIFGIAVFAINKYAGDDYAKVCKLIGGVILVLLGTLMVFFPEMMR
ncbi:MAG: hypothetical protein ACTSXQ_04810 [Alphaproteobacteria bacterium]